jgi:hypothetical protein
MSKKERYFFKPENYLVPKNKNKNRQTKRQFSRLALQLI